ncbi:MAG: hypothetical protein L0215_15805 [Gemmataceae bacterium]|nr:hypothetical protein [Gemmataceae bacterium]
MRRLFPLATLVAAYVLLRIVAASWACCTAFPRDQPVQFADQAVIIYWDAANKIEHFVRKASFQAKTKDFGFIVPTPTQPTLAEAKNSIKEAVLSRFSNTHLKVVRAPSRSRNST